jgi:hypothetical protein
MALPVLCICKVHQKLALVGCKFEDINTLNTTEIFCCVYALIFLCISLLCCRLQTGLGIAVVLIGFELLTFLTGITMFMSGTAMICILSNYTRESSIT